MESQAPQRPVMDVTAPAQRPAANVEPVLPPQQPLAPAPVTARPTLLAVHEAPKQDGDTPRPATRPISAPQTVPTKSAITASTIPSISKAQTQTTKTPSTHNAAIILTTLLVMALLAGLTITVYLKSR